MKALSYLPGPCSLISYVRGPLGWGSCHVTSLFLLYHYFYFISHYPWAYELMLLPCQSTFHIFTSLGLYWPTFLLCHPISFLKLPRPIYFLFTFFTPMSFFLNLLGFLGLITSFLPLITFWAYWPLSQPNEFTNSFPGFPNPFTSSLPLIILVGLLGLLYYFLFSLFSYCWASSAIGSFVKSGHQHMSSYICFFINMYNPI